MMQDLAYGERLAESGAFLRDLMSLHIPEEYMLNVSKLHDAERLLQTLANMSAIERKNNQAEELEAPTLRKEPTTLASLLEKDNDEFDKVQKVIFDGAHSE